MAASPAQTLYVRPATPEDVEAILAIYAQARGFMAAHGNPRQWNTTWPPEPLVREDADTGRSFVCCDAAADDSVVGVMVFLAPYDDPTYHIIHDGAWISDAPYGVVHRIAAAEGTHGVGSFCLNWAFEQFPHLRIDTHGDNAPMQRLLDKLGYTRCGIIYVEEDNDPRLAFEKVGA